jgi:hypothetical protein
MSPYGPHIDSLVRRVRPGGSSGAQGAPPRPRLPGRRAAAPPSSLPPLASLSIPSSLDSPGAPPPPLPGMPSSSRLSRRVRWRSGESSSQLPAW